MTELDSAARRALRARAHHLQPVVMIGEAGLTPEVLREINLALTSHELIKVRVLGDERSTRIALVEEICDKTGAHPVQHIGKILVLFRERPPETAEEPKKRRPRKKPARKTKRSYQKT